MSTHHKYSVSANVPCMPVIKSFVDNVLNGALSLSNGDIDKWFDDIHRLYKTINYQERMLSYHSLRYIVETYLSIGEWPHVAAGVGNINDVDLNIVILYRKMQIKWAQEAHQYNREISRLRSRLEQRDHTIRELKMELKDLEDTLARERSLTATALTPLPHEITNEDGNASNSNEGNNSADMVSVDDFRSLFEFARRRIESTSDYVDISDYEFLDIMGRTGYGNDYVPYNMVGDMKRDDDRANDKDDDPECKWFKSNGTTRESANDSTSDSPIVDSPIIE